MNVYDSEKIVKILAHSHSAEETNKPSEADLIIVNTCAVREKAAEKVFSELGRIKSLKKLNPALVIGIGGCLSQQEGKKIFARAPYVDLVFGPQTLHLLPKMYDAALKRNKYSAKIIDLKFYQNEKFLCREKSSNKSPAAFVTIMEGCNNFCSYCTVPNTRGREISRPLAQILNECERLADLGAKEIHFLGQNVNSYRDKNFAGQEADLSKLIYEVAKMPSLERIRFTTSHPKDLNDKLITCFKKVPKLVNYINLPAQSGSDRILKLMHRRYTVQEYMEKVAALRKVRPEISISSDFIVGFPGETEADFLATVNLAKNVGFDASFSFIYSPRPNTLAAKLADELPLREKKARLYYLQEILAASENKISQAMLNTRQKVLVLGKGKKVAVSKSLPDLTELSGRTENNRVVNFLGKKDLVGQVVVVEITEILTNCLRGKFCSLK